jgi:hypothetical protein
MAEGSLIDPDDEPISLDDAPISLDDGRPKPLPSEDEPISLVDSEETASFSGPAVKTFGLDAAPGAQVQFKRPLNADGSGATRCRLFHSKIAVASLEFMEHQINEWLDGDKIEIKHVGQIIGTMEGKRPEPNLMVIVWY